MSCHLVNELIFCIYRR